MASTNQQLAALFQEMADILEILGGDPFRITAFQKAGRVLEELTRDVKEIGPDPKALAGLPGIGKGTAERIVQYLKTGRIEEHQALREQIPPGLLSLAGIPGLGPKTIAVMWKQAGIESLDDLKAKVQGEELAALPRFGKKKLENLRKALVFAEAAGERVNIGAALPLAVWLVRQLRAVKGVEQVQYAGSLRRGRETIGDIDLVVAAKPRARKAISDAFVKLETVEEVLAQGPTKSSVRMRANSHRMQVDLRVVDPESYGAALLYFTGSKEHNVELRERAQRMGLRLNEYALARGEEVLASRTEEDVYKALGLRWIPPELREMHGELEQAEAGTLPVLVTLEQIQAELHAHTTASDGHWSIREWAAVAMERGFHTIAVTDHSKGQPQAHGLSPQRLEQHIQDVRAVAAELKGKVTILAGSEVDILADGKLDYPDSLLKELDIVVASPHAALSQEPAVATQRLLRALENRYISILGHPTGRLVGRRAGLSPDIHQLVRAAAQRGVALEINANHYRLDLRDTHARAALEAGCKLAINTDAHGPADLEELRYGVLTARRAGATAADVINCLGPAELRQWLAGTRRG